MKDIKNKAPRIDEQTAGEIAQQKLLGDGERVITNYPIDDKRMTERPSLEEYVSQLEADEKYESVRVVKQAYDVNGRLLPDHVTVIVKRKE